MKEYRGPLRVVEKTQASGAGGDTICYLQPPEGEVWDLYALSANQPDVARTVDWLACDTISGNKVIYELAAFTGYKMLYTDIGFGQPLRLSAGCYLGFRVLAMAGSKTITLEALVERIVGVPVWNGA